MRRKLGHSEYMVNYRWPCKWQIAVTCWITLNHPSTAAMRLMSNYFNHLLSSDAHLDSRTDSQALRAEYCIVGIPYNTAI